MNKIKAIICVSLMIPTAALAGEDSCDSSGWIRALVNEYGLFVLCAASETVAGADSVCDATLGKWWQTVFPENLAHETSRPSVSVGLEWLCAVVTSLPPDDAKGTIDELEAWLVAFSCLESLDHLVGPEDWATAIAYVPAVADLFPRGDVARAQMERNVGSALASAELAGLHYNLARRLSKMSDESAAECLRDLWVEALK